MKTNFSLLRTSVYATLGFLSILLYSCGSSQSTTYNDRDGIYGATANTDGRSRTTSQNNQYKEYFGSLQESNEPDQIFTDVEGYRSDNYENTQTNQNYDAGYGSWGSNPGNVTVNVYDNSWGYGGWGWNNYWYSGYWGWNLGWGWNSWYGPAYYGWGYGAYPYYGYGYNGWYHYYPYGYGYNNGYAYNNGRRSSGYRNVVTAGGRNNSYYNTPRGSRNSYSNGAIRTRTGTNTRYSTYNTPRGNNVRTAPSNSNTREYNQAPRGNVRTQPQYNAPRNNGAVRSASSPAPRNNSYTPSSAPARSSGGGSYGGGGRSGGGGGRR